MSHDLKWLRVNWNTYHPPLLKPGAHFCKLYIIIIPVLLILYFTVPSPALLTLPVSLPPSLSLLTSSVLTRARCHEKCPEMGNSLQNVPPQNVQPQNVQPPNNGQFSQQRGGDGGMETVRRRVPNIDRHGLGEAQGADPPLDVDMKNSRYT